MAERSRIVVVGVSHRRTPAPLRERVHLEPERSAAVAAELTRRGGEAVCLSTCNRTELYLAHWDVRGGAERARGALAGIAGDAAAALSPLTYVRSDQDAVNHLFRVAAGLDSIILGETEILRQVRTASAHGVKGPVLERLFAHALAAGKRARAQTKLASTASLPAAAVELAARELGTLSGRRALVVGAGMMGTAAARQLRSRGIFDVTVANRTPGAGRVSLQALPDAVRTADIVISCTSAPDFVLSPKTVDAARAARRREPLILVDLALPRDIDPAVGRLAGCNLYCLDDLRERTTLARERAATQAEGIVADAAARFCEWHDALGVVPTIVSLRARAEQIRLSTLGARGSDLASLSADERRAVDALTARLVAKLLHEPIVQLKATRGRSHRTEAAQTLSRLFALDTTGENPDSRASGSAVR